MVEITEEGQKLKDRAVEIPEKVATCINLDAEESAVLYKTLYKILGELNY